jgi:hypothetical protein
VPVDNGASQRRGLTNDGSSVLNQASSTQPKESSSESLPALTFTPFSAVDYGPTKFPGAGETNITPIGGALETTSQKSRSQTATKMTIDGADYGPSARAGVREVSHTSMGGAPEVSSQATSENPSTGGPLTPLSQAAIIYYKLLAFDSITNAKVRWVSTVKDLSNAPASPDGNPLTRLTVEAQWTQ